MQFSSAVFLMLFLPVVMLLYFAAGKEHRTYRNAVLLLASLFFYAWGEPVFVFVMLASILVNYGLAIFISKSGTHKKTVLTLSVCFNLGIFFIFKYLTFVLKNISVFIDVPMIEIALPIGISFYTFQIMSYIFDVYYGATPVQHNIMSLTLYITMFPQLVAGPIVRYSTIAHEIETRNESFDDFAAGVLRFVIGLSKKVLVADFLAGIVEKIFERAQFGEIPMLTAWIGAIAYTLEIYFDFSGYSDMAIGLGLCFGFHFLENFNYPYIARSVTEFWKRWHISLTSFFRDYIYIPLGGNRVSHRRHVWNLFVVWLLTGIWHGASWNFIVWGLVYFAIQTLEKYTGLAKRLPRILGHIYTLLVVIILWVLFKANTLTDAVAYLQCMFLPVAGFWDANTLLFAKSGAFVISAGIIGCVPVWKTLRVRFCKTKERIIIWEVFSSLIAVILLGCCLLLVINGSYSPFIYFSF